MKKNKKHNRTRSQKSRSNRKDNACTSSLNAETNDNNNMTEQESTKDQVEKEVINEESSEKQQEQPADKSSESANDTQPKKEALSEEEKIAKELKQLKDDHIRLMAEFDNYRKRTLKEKSELIKNGGEKALKELLPVVDDMERAMANMTATDDASKAIVEGIELIHKKFMDYLASQGVKPIEAVGEAFDDSLFEAIAMVPAPTPEMAGKVIDCTKRGYMLNDKVLRFAAVVVGQ